MNMAVVSSPSSFSTISNVTKQVTLFQTCNSILIRWCFIIISLLRRHVYDRLTLTSSSLELRFSLSSQFVIVSIAENCIKITTAFLAISGYFFFTRNPEYIKRQVCLSYFLTAVCINNTDTKSLHLRMM